MAGSTSRVSRVLMTGPLAPFAGTYGLELKRRGYTPMSSVNQLRQVGRLSRWLEANGSTATDLNVELVEDFLGYQRAGGRSRSGWSRPGLRCLLDVLSERGVAIEESTSVASPTDTLLASFERYLLGEHGLAVGTARAYVSHARRFLAGLSASGLAGVTAGHVTEAVLRKSAAVSVSTTKCFVVGLRSFLRFCFVQELVQANLSQAALPLTGRRASTLPRGIPTNDARALLNSCDRRSALGRRDYAIIIILLRLGLRAREVAALRLDDIGWRAGDLVIRGKGARQDRLPLPAEVGQAIASYLQHGRPQSEKREVFLAAKAPFGPISADTVSSTVRRACRRAGVTEVGAHRLRHTMACQMLSANVPLAQIGQVLRHNSLQTTATYARVDLDRLRLLAAPWPEGAQR